MGDHGPRIDHIIIGAKDIDKAAKHILEVSYSALARKPHVLSPSLLNCVRSRGLALGLKTRACESTRADLCYIIEAT